MFSPTTAPLIEIELGGVKRTLKYGFLALKALEKLFPQYNMLQQWPQFAADMNAERASAFIWAGLLHEYTKIGPRSGEPQITVEQVDEIADMSVFVQIMQALAKLGEGKKVGEEGPGENFPGNDANPPQA